MSRKDAGREDADRAPFHTPSHTPAEWAGIARQAGQRAKQDANARSGPPQKSQPCVIAFLLCGIAFLLCGIVFALAALLLPGVFDRVFTQPQMDARKSQETWLKAHPVASFLYTAFMAAVTAAWFWHRVKLSRRATRQEIERLRVNDGSRRP